jgi:dynein heavy chain
LKFQVVPYADSKDKYKITGVDEILVILDDSSMTIQTMLGTRFVYSIKNKVEMWEKKLLLISEIIDEWLACQRGWMYLENIFNAPDIQV